MNQLKFFKKEEKNQLGTEKGLLLRGALCVRI
jgi:hypothetical protein